MATGRWTARDRPRGGLRALPSPAEQGEPGEPGEAPAPPRLVRRARLSRRARRGLLALRVSAYLLVAMVVFAFVVRLVR